MDSKSDRPFSFALQTDVHWFAQDVAQYLFFASEFETMLEKGHAELEKTVEAEMLSATMEAQEELVGGFAWELHQSASFFPQLHRESLFLTLYNYLEHNLNIVCNGVGKELGSKVTLSDLDGRGVNRALEFLKRVPKFDFSKISDDIGFIRRVNRLRNFVVHNGSILPTNEKDPANILVKAEAGLSGDPGDPVSFEAEFLTRLGTSIRCVFFEVGNEMQRYMKEHR